MKEKLLKLFMLCVIELIQLNNLGTAQVLNIDRENGQDTLSKRFHASFDFNFSLDKQKNDFLDLNNRTELAWNFKKDLIMILLNSTEVSYNGENVIENNGYLQFRVRDNDKRRLFPDSYTQYQWNSVLGVKGRFLVGSNLRYKWLEKKRADLYTSIGVFYEDEIWDPLYSVFEFPDSIGVIHRKIFRLNTSIKFAVKLGEKIDLAIVNYVQFPLNSYFGNPRWFLDYNLNLAFNNKWSMLIHYEHNYDLYRPLPIDVYYYALTIGLRLQI